MWVSLFAGFVFLGACSPGKQSNIVSKADTVILFQKDTVVVTGITSSVLSCNLSSVIQVEFNSYFKTLLLFANPRIVTLPEGVYELYITSQPTDVNLLSSEQPGFVTVLDIYSVTAPEAKKYIETDISEHIKKIFSQNKNTSSVYISIRFGPIKLADGTYSSKAGELRFSGIKIVQVKN